jgi:glycosyltransferase involved in cell wall biosynthesis
MREETIRILFIGPHRPQRNPSQRFRMEQYFPYLTQQGFICDYSWFISENDDEVFYSRGKALSKFMLLLKAFKVRISDLMQINNYDIIFIQREAFMTGSVFFEKQFARSHPKLIYDFDDAIWLHETSEGNESFGWLKRPAKAVNIIRLADLVITGNNYLADFARQFNDHITIIPTVVDTNVFKPADTSKAEGTPICIGWTGSISTIKHFRLLLSVFRKLKYKYANKICFRLICDKKTLIEEEWIEKVSWNANDEVQQLNQLDIGVMPLPPDEWSKGKCGFKAIQYMSLEIPVVLSPVGVNTEIVRHGINGFLASSEQDWFKFLSMLIDSKELRIKIGEAARKTIVAKYSLQSQLPVLISNLRALTS